MRTFLKTNLFKIEPGPGRRARSTRRRGFQRKQPARARRGRKSVPQPRSGGTQEDDLFDRRLTGCLQAAASRCLSATMAAAKRSWRSTWRWKWQNARVPCSLIWILSIPFFAARKSKPYCLRTAWKCLSRLCPFGVDIPILPAEVERAFTTDARCVFDVGGDDDGAVALGRYHAQFSACPADVFFVVNPFRPRTARVSQVLSLMENVQRRVAYRHYRPGRKRQPRRGDGRGRKSSPVASLCSACRRKAACRWRLRRDWQEALALPELWPRLPRAALSHPGMDGMV